MIASKDEARYGRLDHVCNWRKSLSRHQPDVRITLESYWHAHLNYKLLPSLEYLEVLPATDLTIPKSGIDLVCWTLEISVFRNDYGPTYPHCYPQIIPPQWRLLAEDSSKITAAPLCGNSWHPNWPVCHPRVARSRFDVTQKDSYYQSPVRSSWESQHRKKRLSCRIKIAVNCKRKASDPHISNLNIKRPLEFDRIN
jgi:hypothetical protein